MALIIYVVLKSSKIWDIIRDTFLANILKKTGLNSFGIYLLHPVIVYFIIPIINGKSFDCLSKLIENDGIVNSINFIIMLLVALILSSILTIIFNVAQDKLYSWMNRITRELHS